ncbi:hypothetical protein [Endothiovibrio diazotrophicus]
MTRLSAPSGDINYRLRMEFSSTTRGIVYPLCDTCTAGATSIEKIF